MELPKQVMSVSIDQFIERVWLGSFVINWKMLCYHYEKNNSGWKDIRFRWVVIYFLMNFGSHIWRCSFLTWGDWSSCCEPKVYNFELKFMIKHNVFRFQVSMSNSSWIQIDKSFNKLLEVISSKFLIQGPSLLDNVKEFSSCANFIDQIMHSFLNSSIIIDVVILSVPNESYDVRVFKIFKNCYFSVCCVFFSLFENFKGEVYTVFIDC